MGRLSVARALMLVLLIGLCSGSAVAEQLVRDGEFIVRYSAVNTNDITPEVARDFGIQRRRDYALLVVNAQRETAPGTTVSVPAAASGTSRSLANQFQKLELRKAREADVYYVLSEFQILDQEVLIFELSVLPEGALRPIALKFSQQFYYD